MGWKNTDRTTIAEYVLKKIKTFLQPDVMISVGFYISGWMDVPDHRPVPGSFTEFFTIGRYRTNPHIWDSKYVNI